MVRDVQTAVRPLGVSPTGATRRLSTPAQELQLRRWFSAVGLDADADLDDLTVAVIGVPVDGFGDLWARSGERLLAAFRGWAHFAGVAGDLGHPDLELIEPGDPVLRSDRAHRRLMAGCGEAGLDRPGRHRYAEAVLGGPVWTYAAMPAHLVGLLIDGLAGAAAIAWLRQNRTAA